VRDVSMGEPGTAADGEAGGSVGVAARPEDSVGDICMGRPGDMAGAPILMAGAVGLTNLSLPAVARDGATGGSRGRGAARWTVAPQF